MRRLPPYYLEVLGMMFLLFVAGKLAKEAGRWARFGLLAVYDLTVLVRWFMVMWLDLVSEIARPV